MLNTQTFTCVAYLKPIYRCHLHLYEASRCFDVVSTVSSWLPRSLCVLMYKEFEVLVSILLSHENKLHISST